MILSVPHLVETIVTIAVIVLGYAFFRKRMRLKSFFFLTLIIAWFAVFSVYLAGAVTTLKEPITVTALNQKNNISQGTQICITGYTMGREIRNLTHPVAGSWAWHQDNKKEDGLYSTWNPSGQYQPADATTYVVLEIPVGRDRALNFQTNSASGVATVEYNGEKQTIDTCNDGRIISVQLKDSSDNILISNQWKQLPVFIGIFCVLVGLFFVFLFFIFRNERIQNVNRFRFLFSELVKRDFTLKYKRTVLGMLWSVLSPLINLLIMWFVFQQVLATNINHFVIYMFAGQLVFGFFNEATNQGMTSLVDNASIFTKINVPKYLFLLSKNVSSLINFGLTLIIFFIFFVIEGLPFTPKLLLLVYPIICQIIFNFGLGLILSALFMFFRDMSYLWGLLSQLIMWLSAVFYSISSFTATVQKIFLLNPVYLFIRYFRKIVIESAVPTVWFHLLIAAYALAFLGIGSWMYKKYNHEFLYYV